MVKYLLRFTFGKVFIFVSSNSGLDMVSRSAQSGRSKISKAFLGFKIFQRCLILTSKPNFSQIKFQKRILKILLKTVKMKDQRKRLNSQIQFLYKSYVSSSPAGPLAKKNERWTRDPSLVVYNISLTGPFFIPVPTLLSFLLLYYSLRSFLISTFLLRLLSLYSSLNHSY